MATLAPVVGFSTQIVDEEIKRLLASCGDPDDWTPESNLRQLLREKVIWCYVELSNDAWKRVIALRSTPQTEIRPLGAWAWVFSALFNFLVAWSVISASMSYDRSGDGHAVVMEMVWVISVVALDTGLIKRTILFSQR
jgi:hypothetical protein